MVGRALSLALVLCLVGLVWSQQAFQVPSAGFAEYSARLVGSRPGSQVERFGVIAENDFQWTRLGNVFSFEFWFRHDAPLNNPVTGAWSRPGPSNEFQFAPLISRHPQNGASNEWAHFHIQITRTLQGMSLVGWSGCGCLNDTDPTTCGYGYLLSSDSSSLPATSKVYILPGVWNHAALVFDGDGTSTGLETRTARLYINSRFVIANTWAATSNRSPAYKRAGLCVNQGMVTDYPGGAFNEVRLGYLKNQDAITRGNPFLEYGFFGLFDEVKIWKVARTSSQIRDSYDLALLSAGLPGGEIPGPAATTGLIAYYRFNDPTESLEFTNFLGQNGQPRGVPAGTNVGNTFDFFSDSLNLTISQAVTVSARSLTKPIPGPKIQNDFFLKGFNPGNGSEPLQFVVTTVSPALRTGVIAGLASLVIQGQTFDPTNSSTLTGVIPIGGALSIFADCSNETCGILGNYFKNYYVEYIAFNSTSASAPARVYFSFSPECPFKYDSCGVCGGDDRTCSCVWYRDFRNTRMAFTLLKYSTENILKYLNCSIDALRDTLAVVDNPTFDYSTVAPDILDRVQFLTNFYDGCASPYCSTLSSFVGALQTYLRNGGVNVTVPVTRLP